jgi:hypothetical protein
MILGTEYCVTAADVRPTENSRSRCDYNIMDLQENCMKE